jgi:dihydrofolate reductase
MQINLIWAQARNRVIGLNGAMPWHLPEDLAHLKRTTLGCPVIMGRKTWDSIPAKFRPLPGRTNIVLTRQSDWQENGAQRVSDLNEALSYCKQLANKPDTVWVIGGAQIYAQALPLAHKIVMTQIDATVDGDSFAPQLDSAWVETLREAHVASNNLPYSFVHYIRRA